jgi:urease accessory protein
VEKKASNDEQASEVMNIRITRPHSSAAALVTAVFAVLWPLAAWAHIQSGQAGGFLSGLSHPVSGLDHVLAMVAVGLWGAQLGTPALWVLPVAFPMMMAFGGMLGLMGMPLPGVEVGIALSAMVLGALVLGGIRLSLIAAVLVVAFFALFHGHAHGTELEAGQNAMLYSLGFVIATGLLHAVGIGIGLIQRWDFGRTALRGVGGLVLAGGLYFFWGAVT